LQWPHRHGFTPQRYAGANIGNHNYCRNANGARRPWCYTTTWWRRAEYCDVPDCRPNEDYTLDTWQYDLGTDRWRERLPPKSSPLPTRRAHNTCALVGQRLYVYGGLGGDWRPAPLGDLWEMDLQTNVWREVRTTTASPAARYAT
jgi:hypothetical protein